MDEKPLVVALRNVAATPRLAITGSAWLSWAALVGAVLWGLYGYEPREAAGYGALTGLICPALTTVIIYVIVRVIAGVVIRLAQAEVKRG